MWQVAAVARYRKWPLRLSQRKDFTLERGGSGQGGCVEGGVPPVAPQQPGLSPLHEVIPPKRQAVVDRLRRRIESYRRRQTDCMPRFDQSFNGLCEQNLQDTLQLKQRYLDQKTKRPAKPKDKKQQDTIQSSVHVQQKFLKRSAEEHDPGGPADNFEPPVKLQCTTQHGSHQPEGLTKFSVEIVQQLEFTTSAANSQPQQISTNVTVKAHTNASVKSDVASPKSNPSTPGNNKNVNIGNNVDVSNLVECVKQEPNNDFADLEECAAAVEKDAANGGMGFGTITDLIGDDTNDEIFTSPAFKDLISDITSYPEFNFDFEDKNESDLKVEDLKDIPIGDIKATHSPLVQNQNYSPPVFETKNRIPPYSNMDFGKNELSPAAQTLKQMAEQHQHKNQMGLSFNPNNRAPNSRSPYPDFQLGDYGSPNSNSNFHKNSPNFPQADMIKQEMIFQGNEYDMKRKGGIYKQQYSPYGSPSPGSHGSPGYLPRSNAGSNNGSSNNASFSGATPPRPPSGPGGNNSGTTLQINQAQSMHISQQSHGHNIQVSAGQHLHLSGDLKGNVSIATQQGLHFHQNSQSNSTSQAQSNHQNAQNNSQQNPLSAQQQQQQQQQQQSQQQSSNQSSNPSNQSNQHSSSSMLSDNHNMQQNPMQNNMNQSSNMSGIPSNGSMNSGPNNHPSAGNMQGNSAGGGMPGSGSMGMGGNNIPGGMGSSIPGGIGSSMGGSMGPGMMGGMNQHHGMPGSQHMSSQQMGDSYSMTQSQTINFTQQTLRQRNGGVPNPMGGGPVGLGSQMGGPMGPNTMRHMSPMEQQKVLQQQQIFRAQQQAAMQQQQPLMVRPPPPDYKTSAGMMQGMGPRYSTPAGAPPSTMRRMPHQTMPPSGPMMRPHMYMMQQQQHMAARGMYPRQQTPIGSMDSMPQHGSAEWRHMMMAQQQSGNFNPQMRPNFQHQSFNMNSGGMQLQSMQQPQMRSQHGGMGGMGQGQMMSQQGPMAQMSSMNQQMMMQQQQSVVQGNAQMSMTNIHMQQSQSLSVSGQGMHQQQQTMNNQQQLVSSSNSQQQNNMNSQSNELFDMLGIPADNGLTEQDLLNTFASDSFNLNDIGF